MDKNYTPEKLNELSKEALVLMVLSMQEQLASVNAKLDKLTEQIAIALYVTIVVSETQQFL